MWTELKTPQSHTRSLCVYYKNIQSTASAPVQATRRSSKQLCARKIAIMVYSPVHVDTRPLCPHIGKQTSPYSPHNKPHITPVAVRPSAGPAHSLQWSHCGAGPTARLALTSLINVYPGSMLGADTQRLRSRPRWARMRSQRSRERPEPDGFWSS